MLDETGIQKFQENKGKLKEKHVGKTIIGKPHCDYDRIPIIMCL